MTNNLSTNSRVPTFPLSMIGKRTWRFRNSDSVNLLSLNKSFRSHPRIVRFVNSLFSELMGERVSGGPFDAAFNPLDAARGEGEEQAPRVEVVLYSDGMFDASAGRAEQNRRAAKQKLLPSGFSIKSLKACPCRRSQGPCVPYSLRRLCRSRATQ